MRTIQDYSVFRKKFSIDKLNSQQRGFTIPGKQAELDRCQTGRYKGKAIYNNDCILQKGTARHFLHLLVL